MSFLQMSLHGAVMIAVITILRALTLNQVPKKTFLVLWRSRSCGCLCRSRSPHA